MFTWKKKANKFKKKRYVKSETYLTHSLWHWLATLLLVSQKWREETNLTTTVQ